MINLINPEQDDPPLPVDCIAVGDLYKLGGSKGGRKSWKLRRFFLAGRYLIYYNKNGTVHIFLI